MDIRRESIDNLRDIFVEQVIIDKIQYLYNNNYNTPEALEAMKSLGFTILSHLDGCGFNEIRYYITPYQELNSEVDEYPVIIHPTDISDETINYLEENDLGNGGEAMHDIYFNMLKDKGLHTFPGDKQCSGL